MLSILRERYEMLLDDVARELRLDRAPRVRRVSSKRCPEAITCDLDAMQLQTVTGVAVVGCTVRRSATEREDEATSVLETLAVLERVPSRRASPEPASPVASYPACEFISTPLTVKPRGGGAGGDCGAEPWIGSDGFSPFSPRNGADSPDPMGSTDQSTPLTDNLFDKGYILFTDEFAARLDGTPLSVHTEECRSSATTPEPVLRVDSRRSQWRQRNTEVRHYLSLGESEHRPLFRRRPSELVYGRSTYETTVTTESS